MFAVCLLWPWRLKFAVDAPDLYAELFEQARQEAEHETLGWLAAAGFGVSSPALRNAPRVRKMSLPSAALAVLTVAQTMSWLLALAVQ